MESYKWYKEFELLPENANLPQGKWGIDGFFVVAMGNGDLVCATRMRDGNYWYWDADNDFSNAVIESCGITHWMRVEIPKA